MPIKWKRGQNPYIHNYFGFLGVGPNTPPREIQALANKLLLRKEPRILKELSIEQNMISEACSRLLEDEPRILELLLVHPDVSSKKKRISELKNMLKQKAILNEKVEFPELLHPACLFWFLPEPGPEVVELPDYNEFDLAHAGSVEDTLLDIVFDI